MKYYLLTAFVSALAVSNVCAAPVIVESPDGRTMVSFEEFDGRLFYSVQQEQRLVVERSAVGIFPGTEMSIDQHSIREHDSIWSPSYGQFRNIRDHYRELTLTLRADDTPIRLLCRVFDTGIGFSFVLSEESKGRTIEFSNDYKVVDGAEHYVHGGEGGVRGPVTLESQKQFAVPLVTQRKDGRAVALLESDLYSAVGFESMRIRFNAENGAVEASNAGVSSGAGQQTPWRVILLGENLGDLLVNTVALNLAAPCKLADASWVKPGKGLWDWRIHGYDNGEFVYGIDTRSYLRLIDFASEQGLEYLTIDDHWFTEANAGQWTVAAEVDIRKVMDYAKEKGVRVVLYYDRKKGVYDEDLLYEHFAGLGASGMKYGFMGNKAAFTRDTIDAAAENKLVINFHDGPCPMTGVERTMPNLITREYCHAQQDARRAFSPESFIKMAMVSALVGPLDQANGNFGIRSINAGERAKGPRKKDSYISTVVSEVARTLVVYTGLVTLPDAPEEYRKKADLFEFLKQMPVTWDETRVLNSRIGEYITIARRSGDIWFVGSVNSETPRELKIPLDLLTPGKTYEATLYQDTAQSHGIKNPEVYSVVKESVKAGDMVTAKMAMGGGHAMILRPSR